METQLSTETKSDLKPSPRPKIMIVDDDPALRQALILRLRANNYEVVSAGDGFSALALAQKVIVLTARDPQANERATLEAGAVAFFQKPADNDELLSVIRIGLNAGSAWGGRLPS